VFDGFYEFPIGLGRVRAAARHAARSIPSSGSRRTPRWRSAVRVAPACSVRGSGDRSVRADPRVLHQERSFFGVLRVEAEAQRSRRTARCMHGTTSTARRSRAGGQGDHLLRPAHGIEIALAQRDPNVPSEIGVIGLGTGTLARYGRPAITSATSRSTRP
jgi:hypothetical protein